MSESISSVIPEITVHDNRAVTTSIAVANFFGKQYRDVTKKIRSLECSPAFTTANFCAVVINAQAGFDEREIEAFEMTRNGFIFLVMGFTGKKAAAFKEAYIAEFDRMENELREYTTSPSLPTLPMFPAGSAFRYITDVNEQGQVVAMNALRPEEFVATVDGHTEMLRRYGYVVIGHDNLKNLTLEEIMRLGEVARLENLRWEKGCQQAALRP
ncbi:Rha family transcriptional regulator [Cedecea davisae]|uniref:Rha family transcriptional regulator n=1 Tax=Cedecea davisae TaxID=158484 RepID=UPI00242DB152|nr:Rha family transcriptional regulator [Cedecea davisae]